MYDLLPSEDEAMIAASVREFLESELPIERLRPGAKPVDHDAVWQAMADLGWFCAGLPESAGGSGMGLVAEVLIQRECGRHLVSPKVLANVLAGHVAHHAGDDALAANFATGKAIAALAVGATPQGDDEGRKVLAIDWDSKTLLLHWNRSGMGLFEPSALKAPQAAGCVDESVSLHSARIEPGTACSWADASQAPLSRRADILLAAALVGLAERACDLAVDYAKLREQFGQPIGAFQAIKHRCADMAVRQRLAWYQSCLAALKLEADAEDAALQVASARLLAAETAHENGRACIQIHGGIGFQSECDAHWFAKRAVLYDQAGGAMAHQAERVIAQPRPEW